MLVLGDTVQNSVMTADQDLLWGVWDICHVSEEGHIEHLWPHMVELRHQA
jgi:hypothetical protein